MSRLVPQRQTIVLYTSDAECTFTIFNKTKLISTQYTCSGLLCSIITSLVISALVRCTFDMLFCFLRKLTAYSLFIGIPGIFNHPINRVSVILELIALFKAFGKSFNCYFCDETSQLHVCFRVQNLSCIL